MGCCCHHISVKVCCLLKWMRIALLDTFMWISFKYNSCCVFRSRTCVCECVICVEYCSVSCFYIFLYAVSRKTSGTIDVIGGGTATISRVEGRRRHNLEGNNIQVRRCNTFALNQTIDFLAWFKRSLCVCCHDNPSCLLLGRWLLNSQMLSQLQLRSPLSSLLDQFLQTYRHLLSSLRHPMSALHPHSFLRPVSSS